MEKKQISCDQKLCLIAQNLKSDDQIFYTTDNRQFHYQHRVNELRGRRIKGCFYGWVILSDHSNNILWSLWNPLTSMFIPFPPLITIQKDHYECCLSSPPQNQGSVFLLFSVKNPTISFCRLGPKKKILKWIKRSYAKQLQSISGKDDYHLVNPVSCNGKIYALVLRSYNIVIHVDIVGKGKEVVIKLLPLVSIPSNSPWSRCPSVNTINNSYPFLKGHCLDLFYIEVGYRDKARKTIAEVTLFKLDMTRKNWKEIVDLENAVFFLELVSGCFSCYYSYAVDSELAGYIHILGECGKVIYSCHVKDRTMSLSLLPCQASTCAMLEWRLKADHTEEQKDKDTEIVVRPVKGEFDSATSESRLLSMPLNFLELIMELCIGVEYMNFRATCKLCCSAAPAIQWRTNNTKLRSYSLVSPWLMVLDNYQDTITFIDPMYGDRYFITTPQELKGGYEIHCSKYGWLLMYKNKGEPRLVFFNPFTGVIRELPEIFYTGSFCFSAPPTSPDCMVVGFSLAPSMPIFTHFVSGEQRWRRHRLNGNPYSLQFRNDPYSFNFPTFSGRYIYALCKNERIEAFRDVTRDGYCWELVANKAPSRIRAQYFLLSCDQHLLLVIVGEFGGSVEVFKVTQEWEKIDNLGKHMIYVSNTSCFCLEAKLPKMGNKIYFPRLLHDDNTKIVFYSLETCRYHTFDEKKIQESVGADLFGTKNLCHPHAWIEPSWS